MQINGKLSAWFYKVPNWGKCNNNINKKVVENKFKYRLTLNWSCGLDSRIGSAFLQHEIVAFSRCRQWKTDRYRAAAEWVYLCMYVYACMQKRVWFSCVDFLRLNGFLLQHPPKVWWTHCWKWKPTYKETPTNDDEGDAASHVMLYSTNMN